MRYVHQVLDFNVEISELSCVILYALNELIAIAAMAMPSVMNLLGLPGEAISVVCGNALIMSWKSSMDAEISMKLTSMMVFAIVLKVLHAYQAAWHNSLQWWSWCSRSGWSWKVSWHECRSMWQRIFRCFWRTVLVLQSRCSSHWWVPDPGLEVSAAGSFWGGRRRWWGISWNWLKELCQRHFLTFATDFQTEAPALEHHFWNCLRPNWEAPVCKSLYSTFVWFLRFLELGLQRKAGFWRWRLLMGLAS